MIADNQNKEGSSDLDDEDTDQEAPTNTVDDVHARSNSDNDEQTLLGKDRSHWPRSVSSQVTAGQLQQHDIIRIRAGPTSYSTSRIKRGSSLSSFHILFNDPMLRNIQKCIALLQRHIVWYH